MSKRENIGAGVMQTNNKEDFSFANGAENMQRDSLLNIFYLMTEILKGEPLSDFLSQIHKLGLNYRIRVLYEVKSGLLKEVARTPDCEPFLGIYPVNDFFNKEQFIAKINHETIEPVHVVSNEYIAHPISWNYDEPKSMVLLPYNYLDTKDKSSLSLIIKTIHFIVAFHAQAGERNKSASGGEEFVSFASHQLKVPLSSLKSGLDILDKGKFGELDWRYLKIIEIMKKEIQNMHELIMRLLDLSRLQHQIMAMEDHVNILEVIRETINSLEKITHEKSIIIKLICNSALVEDFVSDEMLIKQSMMNLLHNACKYSPINGRILIIIEFDTKESLLTFWIVDEGPGIKDENKAFVFNKFTSSYQVSSDIPSTGLGLAICKRIIELMHGRVTIESPCHQLYATYGMQMREGSEGTAFIVQVPIKIKEAPK